MILNTNAKPQRYKGVKKSCILLDDKRVMYG